MTLASRFWSIPFALRLAGLCWVVLLSAVAVRLLLAAPGRGTVVPVYVLAAERWLAGEDIYAHTPHRDVYLYGPGLAAGFTTFTALPLKCTELIWRAISISILLFGLWKWATVTQLSTRQSGYYFAMAAVLTMPCVNNGQPNVLIIGLILLGFAWLHENNYAFSAGAFAFAAAIKLYPVAALLLAVLAVPRLGRRAVVAIVIVLALPFALQSQSYVFGEYQSLMNALRGEDRSAAAIVRAPHDWTILPRLWLGVIVPATIAQAVSALAGLGFALRVLRAPSLAFPLASIWMTLFGPCTEIPTYTLLAPAAAWWIVRHPSWRSYAVGLLLAAPIVRGAFPTSEVLAFRSAAPLAAMLLLAEVMIVKSRHVPTGVFFTARVAVRESGSRRLQPAIHRTTIR